MTELLAANAIAWLERYTGPLESATARELGGGVSNNVILVEAAGRRAVIKQSLGKLRVEEEWLSDRARIFREADAMRFLAQKIRGGRIPRILAEDRGNFAIAMEAAPANAEMWKPRLFRGEFNPEPAQAAGSMLGSMIAASWRCAEAERLFGDCTVFDQLRVDAYYRFTAARRPEAADYIYGLIEESNARRVSLAHGDWSPKNLLVSADEVWAIDWEVIHFGDPSFDVGFLLNHLLLKSIAMPHWKSDFARLARAFVESLQVQLPHEGGWIVEGGLRHLPALLAARVDGKSPVEYLDEAGRIRARSVAMSMMREPVSCAAEAFER